ncbi:NUDIX hydrolase [Jannaschia sp. S6380]|uniref:NUDIX domain-containing protein n=1 Tax=Jannaschia sp. S6380 TaxID=2926408 RepID=UPI001FF5CC7C|nr:NUDIX hydrolase [Jannaschia sp. S6380]MCK0168761.1 NUDIX hydrolase [Jannaschia sp. S6380]
MTPRYGRPPRAGIRYRRRPGAYAILLRGDAILLTVQQSGGTSEIQLPGGGVDAGESPRPALLREIREETGHSAAVIRRLGAFRDFTYMPEYDCHAEKVCHVYLARPGRRLGPATEAGHTALWLPARDAVAQLVSPGARRMLAGYLRRNGR